MHITSSAAFAALAATTVASYSLSKRDYVGQETQITFFGYPDNCDDSGCYKDQTAYDCINPDGSDRGAIAGGDGTFNNPLTAAIQLGGNFQKCAIGYMTYLQKFIIFDGFCASCDVNHIDIWVESSCSDTADNVCACEDQLTPGGDEFVYYDITADDPSVFSVDTTALYDSGSQSCSGHVYSGAKKDKRDRSGQLQSPNPKLARDQMFGVPEKWLNSRRQTGACAENSCVCDC